MQAHQSTTPEFLTMQQVKERFPFITISRLRKGRLSKDPDDAPPHVRLSERKVVYKLDDVLAWLDSRREGVNTNDPPPKPN